MIINIPNLLTLIRILVLPVFVIIFYLPFWWSHLIAALIFAIASITDWLDGYIAHNTEQVTRFGAFLDPVADKLMVAVALILVVGEKNIPYLTIPAAIIVAREIIVSALREWMAEIGKHTSVRVNRIAKLKTGMQMLALILLLLYRPYLSSVLVWSGSLLLYIAAILTLWSMCVYLRIAWPDLTFMRDKQ